MIKSKSNEELSRSIDSALYESASSSSGAGETSSATRAATSLSSNYEITPTPDREPLKFLQQKERRHEVLDLNEETNTWKMVTKRKRKPNQSSNLQSCFEKLLAYLKHENASEFRFRIIVALLFFCLVFYMLLTRYLHYNSKITTAINKQIFIHSNMKKITFLDHDGNNLLHLLYGRNIPNDIKPINCLSISQSNLLCYDWKYRAYLSVMSWREQYSNSFQQNDTVTCFKFLWRSYEKYSTSIKDCFDLSDAFWYGMGDLYNLKWPLNLMSVSDQPLITSHQINTSLSGSIIGRTWFSSKGISITVPLDVPLFVSINSTEDPNKLCFTSKKQQPYYTYNAHSYFAHLEYSICLAQNVSTLQNYQFENYLKISNSDKSRLESVQSSTNQTVQEQPNQEHETENIFLDRIIWSTNVNVLPNFTQQTVQSYVDQITNYGLAGIILLDSRWENSIGELKMNETVFNNPKVLVNILHNKGFKIMLTISPNIALRSNLVDNATRYIMLDTSLRTPLLTRCSTNYQKICAVINFTNPSNCEQFKSIIVKELLNHQLGLSVDGLYFAGIQSSLIPRHLNYEKSINPDKFLEYFNGVIKGLQTSVGISVSVNSRNIGGYVTLYPRDSSWEALQSIIPAVLSLGMLGYPLINSDIVGGAHLFSKIKNETDYIDKELYLRWLQLAIFLPVVQFAEPPGGNDLDVVKIAKRLLKLRSEHFVPVMKSALVEHNRKGSPIIRPMWWAQNHADAYSIKDQFMVGNDIIVAPIVDQGKTERDIYLPHGWWKDEILAQVIRGGKWMLKYQVPLDKVAFFVRTEPSQPTT